MAESNQQGTMGQALRKGMETDKEVDTVKGTKPNGTPDDGKLPSGKAGGHHDSDKGKG